MVGAVNDLAPTREIVAIGDREPWHFACSIADVDVRPSRSGVAPAPFRWIAIGVVAASFAYVWTGNVADEDLWNRLTFGELALYEGQVARVERWSYSAPGHPYFNHEWLTEVIFVLCMRAGGVAGLFALKVLLGGLVVLGIVASAATLARARGMTRPHPVVVAGCLVLVLAVMAPGATFRAQLFTMACLALEWFCLERAASSVTRGTAPWTLAVVPLLIVGWTNAHGGFVVGVALHGVFTLVVGVAALRSRRPATAFGVGAVGLLSLAAVLVNPYGIDLVGYLVRTLHEHGAISEWQPVPIWSLDHAHFKALVILVGVASFVTWRTRGAGLDDVWSWRLLFLVFAAWYGLRHRRHTVLFAIAAAPLLIVEVETLWRRAVARWPMLQPRPHVAWTLAMGALAVASVQVTSVGQRLAQDGMGMRYPRSEFPVEAIAFIRAADLRGNMLIQFEWGGYALYHLGTRAKVFIDGRFEASYPRVVMDDYFTFVDARPGWERALDAYPTEVVVLDPTMPVVQHLAERTDFARVYADGTAMVWVRATPTNAAALSRLTALAWRPSGLNGDVDFP